MKVIDELTKDYTEAQIQHIIEIYKACSLYELGFWDMAWNGGTEI